MNRQAKIKSLLWLCLLGIIGSLTVWALPVSWKPYHFKRALDDYKTELVEQSSEWGFDADGLVKVRYSRQFSGGTRSAIDRIRKHWYADVEHARDRWPTDGKRLHYDEWGPSNWQRSDGVHEIEVGSVWCIPYSFIATICALPLLAWVALKLRTRSRGSSSGKTESLDSIAP